MTDKHTVDVEENKADGHYGDYRKLGQPADTISGATQDLLEVRPSGTSTDADTSATSFKVIAVIAIIAIILGIIASQVGAYT